MTPKFPNSTFEFSRGGTTFFVKEKDLVDAGVYQLKKTQGVCIADSCREPSAPDSLRCIYHRDAWRHYHRTYMKRYRANGKDSWLNRKKGL